MHSEAGTSTVDLVALAQQGDRSALERLFARHSAALRRWASGRLPGWARDLADTDDIVQEALLQTFRRIEDFEARGAGCLHAYLRQAVANRIRDELRRKARRPDFADLDSALATKGPSPLEQAIGRDKLERYERALATLKAKDQEAIIARVEMGCAYHEMAESLGKPSPEAARKAAQRALPVCWRQWTMTPPDGRPIDDLLRAVLDGDVVDWTEAESRGGETRRLAGHLRVVAAVANAHRAETAPGIETPPADWGFTPPWTWGHLRIIQRIGRGNFGEVYHARDLRLERDVAPKLVPVNKHEGPASSMLREGRLLARIRHPNVVTIYGADYIGGWIGLWMELVHGRTLEELLWSGQAFGPTEVARIGVELARALDAVHAAGLIHRDIKAQNVMREDGGRIVLMDFGAGRGLNEGGSDLTGTPLYLAPEIFRGQRATVQTDIYSLGVLLYHLLTRSYPVCGDTIRKLRRAHEEDARPSLPLVRSDVPRRLKESSSCHQSAA